MSPAQSDISSRRPPTKRGRVEGMEGYIPAALVAPTLADAERLYDRLNARPWSRPVARSMAADPRDETFH